MELVAPDKLKECWQIRAETARLPCSPLLKVLQVSGNTYRDCKDNSTEFFFFRKLNKENNDKQYLNLK